MRLGKICPAILLLILAAMPALAKKEPKFEQAHQLTPEQAALVQRAIAREKIGRAHV